MNKEAQRIAIAEVHFQHWLSTQGFKPHQRTDDEELAFRGGSSLGLWIFSNENQTRFWGCNYSSEDDLIKGETETWSKSRNYPEDLNAMHEAEKMITPMQTMDYERQLAHQIYLADKDDYWKNRGKDIRAHCFHATASQRAEAFLRAVSKWIE